MPLTVLEDNLQIKQAAALSAGLGGSPLRMQNSSEVQPRSGSLRGGGEPGNLD
jgi:hypothetical protein